MQISFISANRIRYTSNSRMSLKPLTVQSNIQFGDDKAKSGTNVLDRLKAKVWLWNNTAFLPLTGKTIKKFIAAGVFHHEPMGNLPGPQWQRTYSISKDQHTQGSLGGSEISRLAQEEMEGKHEGKIDFFKDFDKLIAGLPKHETVTFYSDGSKTKTIIYGDIPDYSKHAEKILKAEVNYAAYLLHIIQTESLALIKSRLEEIPVEKRDEYKQGLDQLNQAVTRLNQEGITPALILKVGTKPTEQQKKVTQASFDAYAKLEWMNFQAEMKKTAEPPTPPETSSPPKKLGKLTEWKNKYSAFKKELNQSKNVMIGYFGPPGEYQELVTPYWNTTQTNPPNQWLPTILTNVDNTEKIEPVYSGSDPAKIAEFDAALEEANKKYYRKFDLPDSD